jgi:hypothetical protein
VSRALAGARALVAAVLVVVAALDALGWLYLVRPGSAGAGPRVANALPLDELAGHDAVALAPFALVWLGAGAAAGLLVRAARLGRVATVVLTGAGVGATVFATTGMSIVVTQQIAARPAFAAAAGVGAVYLAAGFAAAGAGLIQRAAAASIRGVFARKSAQSWPPRKSAVRTSAPAARSRAEKRSSAAVPSRSERP